MRQIHPVSFHEKFVASGVYAYYDEHNTVRKISDSWSIHELPDGSQKVRVDWESTEDFWVDLIEALVRPSDKHFERFDISAYTTDWRDAHVRASYIFFENHADVGRTYNDDPREHQEVELPSEYIVYPGTRIFQGIAISQAARKNGAEITLISCYPWIDDHTVLRVMVGKWSVSLVGEDKVDIAGKAYIGRRYEQRTNDTTTYSWLDGHDTLLRTESQYKDRLISKVELIQYARRPDPPKS